MIKIRQGFAQLLRGSIIGRLLGAAGNLALSRILNLTTFGSFALYIQLINTAESLCKLGLDYSIRYWTAADPSLKSNRSKVLTQTSLILSATFTIITVFGFALYVLMPGSGFPLAGPNGLLFQNIAVLSALTFECLGAIPWEILLVQQKINSYSLRIAFFGPLKIILAAIGAVLFALNGAILGWLIGSMLQWIWLIREVPFYLIWNHTYPKSLFKSAKALLSKAVPIYSGNLLGQIVFFPLLISLSNTSGINSVGILRVSQIFAQVFGILGGALIPILFVSMRSTRSPEKKSAQLKRAVESIWAISLVLFAIAFIIEAPLTIRLFGADYTESIPATRVLVSCVIIDSISQVIQQSLLVYGKVLKLALTQNVAAIFSAFIGFLLIPYFGIKGYLACRFLYSFLPAVITFILAQKIMVQFSIDWKLIISFGLMIAINIITIYKGFDIYNVIEASLFAIIFLLSVSSGLQQSWREYTLK